MRRWRTSRPWRTPRRLALLLVATMGLGTMGYALSGPDLPPPTASQLAAATLPAYQNVLAKPVAGIRRNLSGLSYSSVTGTLFAVINRPSSIAELSTEGELLRLMPLKGAGDIEGIAHIQGDLFALADEDGNRVRWAQIPAQGKPRLLDRAPLSLPPSAFANLGLEGLAWDARHQRLLLAQERWPMRVVSLDLDGTPHPSAIDEVEIGATDLSSVEVDPESGHVLLLSDESAMVYEYAPSGELIARLPLRAGSQGLADDIPQAEGIAVDGQGRLYVISEPNLFYRFERVNPGQALARR
ncbi:SdiA-regulated domain-containing protein [Comamonas serinivorans]|uniref:SdiA-regulated domain-containing protein n=1 Tax=Comamonas serinivorans TaxID=1082851 RepID=UPI0012F86C2B|nr:SdiA-regulated domain-containing protein [Comamonas serinivorans]